MEKGHEGAGRALHSLSLFFEGYVTEASARETILTGLLIRSRKCEEIMKRRVPDSRKGDGLSLPERERCIGISRVIEGRYREGEKLLTTALMRDRGDVESLISRGLARLLSGDLVGAEEDLLAADRSGEDLVPCLLGRVYLEMGKFEEASRSLSLCEEETGPSPQVLNLKGVLALYSGKIDEAIDIFEQVRTLSPRWVPPVVNIGIALYIARKYDEALTWFNRAVEMDEKCARASFHRELCLFHRGDYEGFTADVRRALELNPEIYYENPASLQSLSR